MISLFRPLASYIFLTVHVLGLYLAVQTLWGVWRLRVLIEVVWTIFVINLGSAVFWWFTFLFTASVAVTAMVEAVRTLGRIVQRQPEDEIALRVRVLFYIAIALLCVNIFVLSSSNSAADPGRVKFPVIADISATIAYGVWILWWLQLSRLRRLVSPGRRRAVDIFCMNAALALFLTEIGLRVVSTHWPTPLLVTETTDHQIRRAAERRPPGTMHINFPVNSGGHYDTEFVARKDLSGPLVVNIGDSFSYGTVPHPFHYTTVAEQELGNVQIYNMGYPFIGPTDYLHLLQSEALQLEPDLIVIQLFVGNDLTAGRGLTGPPAWYDADRYLIAHLIRRLLVLWDARVGVNKPFDGVERVITSREELTAIYPRLADSTREKPRFTEQIFLEIETRNARALYEPVAGMYERLLATLDAIRSRAGSIPLAYVLIPDEFQIEDHLWAEVVAQFEQSPERDGPQEKLKSWMSARGIPVLDLLPILRSVEPIEDGRLHLYHAQDGHFNARGNKVAGLALADFVRRLLSDGVTVMVKKEPPFSIEQIEELRKLTQAYGKVLERTAGDSNRVIGASGLPAPKAQVRAALFRMLDSVGSKEQKEFLTAGLMRLAFFQEGVVGTADLDSPAADGQRWREVVEAEIRVLKIKLVQRGY